MGEEQEERASGRVPSRVPHGGETGGGAMTATKEQRQLAAELLRRDREAVGPWGMPTDSYHPSADWAEADYLAALDAVIADLGVAD